jgi:hypothetical protein
MTIQRIREMKLNRNGEIFRMRSFITDLCPSPNFVSVTVRKSRWNIHRALIEKTRNAGSTFHINTTAE